MSSDTLDVKELLSKGELNDVRFFKVHAEVYDDPRPEFDSEEFEQGMKVLIGMYPGAIEIRIDMTVETSEASYEVTAATQFHYEDEDLEISEELARELAERVGIMAIFPYLREAVQSLAARLRQPPITLPLLRVGEIRLGADRKTDE